MKFIVSKTVLQSALTIIGRCITPSNVIPIVDHYLFSLEDGRLTIAATDLSTSMVTAITVESSDKATIAVPSRILLETLKTLPEQPISFSFELDSYKIEIKAGGGKYKIAGQTGDDFPKIPEVTDPSSLEIAAPVLTEAINNTLFAVSSDELRPAMTGVYCLLLGDRITFVSTDGSRLVRYIRTDVESTGNANFILPKKALTLLKASLPSEIVPVTIQYNKANAFFKFNDIEIICRIIDEKYPAYESIIPLNNTNVLVIERLALLGTLQRLSNYANANTHQVRLEICDNVTTILSEDIDYANEAEEKLDCNYKGEDIVIGFNATTLMGLLKNLSTEEIEVTMSGPNKPCLIKPIGNSEVEDILTLIMPLFLNN